jgi:hypothetical protein
MSKINVNQVDTQCGSTLTLGSSGKTVTLASGASQSGFGRTGTVDWCTTAKTSPFTAVSGDGFFVNTSGGVVTVTLPSSPSAGDIVALKDYANTWDTNAVTLCRNGSKINGVCGNTNLSTESQSVTLIYVDGTKGWQDIHDSTSNVSGNPGFIVATGGTITESGDYKIHTFTGSGCFAVTNTSGSGVGAKVSYVVVAGGAAGGFASTNGSGGGGAGGFREGKQACGGYTASPLAATPCSGLPVSVQTYPISIGAGGAAPPGACNNGGSGSNSIFSTITSTGGGGGGYAANIGTAGGSGGGGGGGISGGKVGGSGNTPPVSPPQGNTGGTGGSPSPDRQGGGGGGATAVGVNAIPGASGAGGAGATTSINGTPTARAGGGGAGGTVDTPGASGAGGAGGGGAGGAPPGDNAVSGTANTGGGGGGGGATGNPGKTGGSGIVIIRYKFQ